MHKLYFLLFFAVFISVYLGLHYYVYSRIARGLFLSETAGLYLRIIFLMFAVSFLLGEFLSRQAAAYPKIPVHYLMFIGAVWLGVISIAFTVFIIKDIADIFLPQYTRLLTVVALALILALCAYSLYNGSKPPVVRNIAIKTSKLTDKIDSFTIAHLSDIHMGPITDYKWLERTVNITNGLAPDLIVITGDLIDEDVSGIDSYVEIIKQLKAKHGVYACTGNHEYYAGIDSFLKFCQKTGIKVIRNGCVTIGGTVELAAIDDIAGRRFGETAVDIKSALSGCDFNRPVILLSHQPNVFDKAVINKIDLQLSGHSHAGQIPPMDLIVWLVFKYSYGLYGNNGSYIYTSPGTGTWGPPMRLFSKSEIVKITLVK